MTTRAELVQRVQVRANTSGYADPNTTIPQLIDVSLARLHNILAGEVYQDYYSRRAKFSIAAYQARYDLPKDFFKLRAVWWEDANNPQYRFRLRRVDIQMETGLGGTFGIYQGIPLSYALEDKGLVLVPTPTSNQASLIHLFYVPSYTSATADNEPIEFQIAPGWEEWVVNDVTHMIRLGASMPAQEFAAERDAFMAHIIKQAQNRDASQAMSVVDDGWAGGYGSSPWGDFAF